MTQQELVDTLNAASKLNPNDITEIQDQVIYLAAISAFAEAIRPLVIKYADRLPEETTFLFKL